MEVEQSGVTRMAYRLPELMEMFQVSKPSIYRLMKNNQFPKPVKFGGSSLWPAGEIHLWWENKINLVH